MTNEIPTSLPPQAGMQVAGTVKTDSSKGIRSTPSVNEIGHSRSAVQYDPEEKRRDLQAAVEHLNAEVQRQRQNLSFRLDESANRFVITVKNTQSGEVVRQIPEDVMLKVARNMEELKGVLHNMIT